jgi:hypothetical protein
VTRAVLVFCTTAVLAPVLLDAEETPPRDSPASAPAPTHSMGQPPVFQRYGGAYYTLGADDGAGGAAYFGVYKDLLPSVVGIGLSGEAYAGGLGGVSEGGVRAMADLRGLCLKTGLDLNFRTGSTDFVLSFDAPLRRGGLLGGGSHLRVDWIPARGNAWQVGVQIPLQRHMGRTRPRDTEVDLPRRPALPAPRPDRPASVEEALGQARVAARWVSRLDRVFWDDSREDRLKSLDRTRREIAEFKQMLAHREPATAPGGRVVRETQRLYVELARAFGLAASRPALGDPLLDAARHALLSEVVLPYNRLFGQWKRGDSLAAFAGPARARFLDAALDVGLPLDREAAVRDVFDAYLRLLEDGRASARQSVGGDSRLVFIPLSLVLRAEEHDTQAEIDALVARAQGTPFTRGNRVRYLSGQQFQLELLRMIHETEDYHVLWLHDYDGVNAAGQADRVGFAQAVDGYLAALTERVREYDRTGRLPVFMVFLDQKYYETNRGRLYMDLLEDPLRHRLKLGRSAADLQERADRAQAALRQAVAESQRLQAEAARHGARYLRDLVKVHVSVTNPVDFSYRTSRLVAHLPIAPDTVIRDHRKIAFRDVTEADPARGEALYAGVAVGEQYATPTWEDRAIGASGPALVTLKDAARRNLLQNGFRVSQVPPPLRAIPRPADYDERVRALEAAGATASALEVHNDRGFAEKDASIVNSMLYTLMPPGSLIVVPSPIWTDPVWAGQLVGAALRGCDVYVIAPSLDNAPSAGFATQSRSREVFSRFFEIQRQLAPEIEAAGGSLRTGLYTRRTGVDDTAARRQEVANGYRRYPFLREDFPLPASFFDALARGPRVVESTALASPFPLQDARQRDPKLHRKTQFLATRESLLALAESVAAERAFREPLLRAARGASIDPEDVALVGPGTSARPNPLVAAQGDLPADMRERSIYYLTVGSLNKDTRGQVLDGEVLYVVSGEWSLVAYTDFAALLGSTTWIESQEQLDELLPPVTHLKRRISRWVRKAV